MSESKGKVVVKTIYVTHIEFPGDADFDSDGGELWIGKWKRESDGHGPSRIVRGETYAIFAAGKWDSVQRRPE